MKCPSASDKSELLAGRLHASNMLGSDAWLWPQAGFLFVSLQRGNGKKGWRRVGLIRHRYRERGALHCQWTLKSVRRCSSAFRVRSFVLAAQLFSVCFMSNYSHCMVRIYRIQTNPSKKGRALKVYGPTAALCKLWCWLSVYGRIRDEAGETEQKPRT